MVIIGAETNILFKDNNQMAIPDTTVVQIVNGGISEVTALLYFDKDILHQIS